ncbi:MAG: DivIVA domain-containing protein [Acidimicrobiia bacterium]
MADELTPGQVRSRRFDVVRRGYDRQQVEQFLDGVADDLDRLSNAASGIARGDLAIGIEDPEALARELHTIGTEVTAVIESARSAAEGMRLRAAEDADSWTSNAEAESNSMLESATEQSQSMRASAWNEGTSLLASAVAEADALVAEAKEASLFVRAEAEREALRLTGDAKRDREEKIRAARLEAEQVLESARTESAGVLSAATQQAELAQERARALEDRRSELLAELEGARASIGQLEAEIEDRRQELEAPEVFEELPDDDVTHHGADSGSVRIVSSSRAVALEPVDPDEFVAEVAALRSGTTEPAPSGQPEQPEPVEQAAPVVEPEAEPETPEEPQPEPEAESDVVVIPATREPVVTEPVVAEAPAPDPPVVEPTPAAPEPAAPESEVEPAGDEIGSLFASLREDAANGEPETSEAAVVADMPPPEEIKKLIKVPKPEPEPKADDQVPEATPDSALIPVQNAALRTIKRSLVDLQNETLEHLRNDDTWLPDSAFTDRFEAPFAEMAYVLTGSSDASSGVAFGADLYEAVTSAIERTRDAGAGSREVASAASKVFRTWRSDEAERRVVDVAQDLSSTV